MATYARALSLTATDAAYVAGLINGEGSITLTREHRNERRRLVVSIANTELELLTFVQTVAGVGRITRKRTTSLRHTPSFTYKVTNRQAPALLRQVAPYLKSCKSKRAQILLEQYLELTPRNGRYLGDTVQRRESFEQAVLNILPGMSSYGEECRSRLRVLASTNSAITLSSAPAMKV